MLPSVFHSKTSPPYPTVICLHFLLNLQLLHMSKPFQPVSEILTSKHKQQTFNDIYGEPENFLEIEVCINVLSYNQLHY